VFQVDARQLKSKNPLVRRIENKTKANSAEPSHNRRHKKRPSSLV
jgi:hypothetical protein